MNKSLAGILGVTVALTLLAGCTAYDRTKDQFTQPVVKDVKKGMSRQQVMQIVKQTFNGSHHGPCPRHLPDLYPRSTRW